MATETERKEPPTPYEAEYQAAQNAEPGSADTIRSLRDKREGYLRAMQDMAPGRESHHTLVEALYEVVARISIDEEHPHRMVHSLISIRDFVHDAIAGAEALEKGETS